MRKAKREAYTDKSLALSMMRDRRRISLEGEVKPKISALTLSQSQTNMHEHKYKERKREANDLTRFDNVPRLRGRREKILIQTTELQGLN